MNKICSQCGKTVNGDGMAFCPYCGTKLAAERAPESREEETEKWISKALATTSYPERKKILIKGLEACPDSREIAWELLFIGESAQKRTRELDFSIIKCWILEIYLKPESFSEEKRNRMRAQLFDAPELRQCLARFSDPEAKQKEYLLRLCEEYVALFLEGNNRIMGNIFGFQIDRNKEKKLAAPVAEMIGRIRKDEKLLPEQREQLWKALYQGYAARVNGKTEYIDALLA